MENLKDYFNRNDFFARACGIELLEAGNGQARARVKIGPNHLNSVSTAQGGLLFTLADFTFAAAANSRKRVALAINASISFLKPAFEGEELVSNAEELSAGNRLASYVVYIKNAAGENVAVFQGMVYIKNPDSMVPKA